MTIIRDAIRFPVTTAVGVILVVLFGALALSRIPVQLTPDVEQPRVTVTTVWPGASPLEVERDIVEEQEEQLKSLEGLVELRSSSSDGRGEISLAFPVGTDLDSALLRVGNRLEQVREYPEGAEKPVILSVDATANAIAWFVLRPADGPGAFSGEIATLFDFADDLIKPEVERVEGIAASDIFGGRTREMHVVVDPAQLAAHGVTLGESFAAALERENRNYSGGDFDEGKRRYIVRTIGEYGSASDIDSIIIAERDGVPIYVRDVGGARIDYRKPTARVFQKGEPVIALNALKEPGANVLDVMAGLRTVTARLNGGRLRERGLRLVQVYDETVYIDSAIGLVQQSLAVGSILAVIVLLLFLRSGTSTLVIAVAIPISVIGAFLLVYAFGRTLNVISLAGMAFAVGMVVDNSIVVLENIYRHRQMGKRRREAAYDGAVEVWGAVLASTLTTIAVFVPIVFIEEEVGQLFGDIALAISCAVGLSLVVSITVIPSLSARILGTESGQRARVARAAGGDEVPSGAARSTKAIAEFVYRMTGSVTQRLLVVVGLTAIAIGMSWLLVPKTEYLPTGNRNFLFGILLPPPGYSLAEVASLEQSFSGTLRQYWEHPPGAEQARGQPGGGIASYFYVARPATAFMGVSAGDDLRVRELIDEYRRAAERIPGSIYVINQRSLFERGRGEGRTVDIEITGPELEQLLTIGRRVFGQVLELLPDAQARPIPSLDLGNPEVRVVTDRRRAAALGLSNRELGYAVSALVDGAKASDYSIDGREVDLRLVARDETLLRTHLLEQMPIATPGGRLVTLGAVADIEVVNGPVQVDHRERERTIVVQVTPDEQMPLEVAMDTIESGIIAPLRATGELGTSYQIRMSGTADKLTRTLEVVRWDFLLAVVITYLLMASLFESFLYPLVILFSVPLAALGGILGLVAANVLLGYQALDVLTMLGFIILVGTVVNNAILIVHQSLNHIRADGMDERSAIREAVSNRIRPIFMSVMTSVCGMLPLILFPGAGSELYRGLGSVVVGGLLLSTVFTLFLVPALFSLTLDLQTSLRRGHRANAVGSI